jgi:nucleoside-diphosphate-sugar epimerase
MAGAGSESGPILVTGAGGFVGHALCAHFRAGGRAFRAHVRRRESAPPHVEAAVGDLAAVPEAELGGLVAGTSAIVQLAGRAHVLRETAPDPEHAYRVANVVTTTRLAEAAVRAGVARFVFASSVKVNGEATASGRPFRPDDPPAPADAYARSKLEAERELGRICAESPTAVVILRLPLVYGPGVGGNFLRLLDAVARGSVLPLGAIDNRRSIVGLGNLVEAIHAALDEPVPPRGVHFVADRESISVPDLARAIATALDVSLRMRAVPVPLLRLAGVITGRRATVARLVDSLEVDFSSFRAAAGWQPRHTLAEELAATARWWRLRHSI